MQKNVIEQQESLAWHKTMYDSNVSLFVKTGYPIVYFYPNSKREVSQFIRFIW